MAKRQRVVDHIVGYLAATGVEYIFGVDGANIEDLYDAAHFRDDITAVLAKHEFSAATMADGYSRSGAGLGVVAATSGGGCLNTVAGLGEALASRVPVLALIGQAPTTPRRPRRLPGHQWPKRRVERRGAVLRGVGVLPTGDDARRHRDGAARGHRGGQTGRPRRAAASEGHPAGRPGCHGPGERRINGSVGAQLGDPQAIARALRHADGPITIIAGEQVARDDARAELAQLRSMLRARVATVPDAKDVAGTPGLGSSSALGVTGVMGHPGVATAIADSALCLLVGTRLTVTARAGLDDALASVPTYSIGSAAPFVPCTHVHTEDLRGSLTTADAAHERQRPPAPACGCRTWCRGPSCNRRRTTAPGCDTARRWPCSMPRCPTASTSSSTPETSARRRSITCLPAATGDSSSRWAWAAWDTASAPALGVAFGRRRRTVVIAGDGSFFMHGMEIHTALQYRLPVTFLLFDNHAHAMCVTREQLFYDDLYSYNRFGPSRLGAGLAAMFPGLASVDVDDDRRSARGVAGRTRGRRPVGRQRRVLA